MTQMENIIGTGQTSGAQTELEQMKQQMELLKKKLESQSIINDKIMKKAMKGNLGNLNRMGRIFFVLGILVAMWAPSYFKMLGCTWWFAAGTFIMLVFCALKTMQYHRELWRLNFNESNILETGKKVTTLRNRYNNWQKTAIPMVSVWFIWLCIESYFIYGADSIWFCGGCAIGGLIGGFIGTRMNKKVISTADSLLEQIKEYEA